MNISINICRLIDLKLFPMNLISCIISWFECSLEAVTFSFYQTKHANIEKGEFILVLHGWSYSARNPLWIISRSPSLVLNSLPYTT